jgi:hypothetical protein
MGSFEPVFNDNFNFPLEWESPEDYPESIKWSLGREKHEAYTTTLNRFELGHIVTHCLTILHKVNKEVGADDAKRFNSYKLVLPRTFSLPLLATWDQVTADFPLESDDVAGFRTQLRHFIEVHATDNDRHELLDSIRHAHKPHAMKVQAFFYRLHELNDHVDWLPGTEPKLTDGQLDQAFHDGMPTTWKERFVNAGRSVRTGHRVELLKFFRDQQHASERAAARNAKKQKDASKKSSGSHPTSILKKSKDKGAAKKKVTWDPKYKSKSKSKPTEKKTSSKVPDKTPCPVHPGSSHT